eukprot:3439565-Rhodomonas_salina.5
MIPRWLSNTARVVVALVAAHARSVQPAVPAWGLVPAYGNREPGMHTAIRHVSTGCRIARADRVWLGSRVSDLGLGAWGLGSRMRGLGFRIRPESRVWGLGFEA